MSIISAKMYFNVCKVTALLILIIFCVCKVAQCENINPDESKMTSDAQIDENTDLFSVKRPFNEADMVRFRRAVNSKTRERCETASQCTGNQTLFETTSTYYNCHCDNACYETFQDCCPDFVKTCGEQRKTTGKNSQSLWKCVELDRSNLGRGGCFLKGPVGIWMITNCSNGWPFDETRAKCENASEKFSYPVEDFLPVVSEHGFTYRNKFCGVCNGEKSYQTWDVVVRGFITPPKRYNIDERIRFALANQGYIQNIVPGVELARRYCAGAKYTDNCSNKTHPDYAKCKDGPVETVGNPSRGYFKNNACAFCNGDNRLVKEERSFRVCGGPGLSQGLSIVFNRDSRTKSESTVTRVVEKYCPSGLVYDDNLQYCREGLVTNTNDTLSDVFFIALWFEQGAIKFPTRLPFNPFVFRRGLGPIPNIKNITEHLKSALLKKFALKSRQVAALKFHRQNFASTFLVATFRLTLTPYQEFILANENNTSNLNISTTSQKFLGLLKFTTNFTMTSGKYRFPVVKLVSRQLACFEGKMLQPYEYEIDNISGNVFQNTTGKKFSRNEYAILGNIGGNITICRKLLLSGCHNGAFVTLNETEFFIYQNLSIFHYATNGTFNFGDYQISEGGTSNRNGLESFQNASFPKNSSIAVCLPFRGTFNTTEKVATKSDANYPLRILTVVGFSVSVLFLILLLVTYGIFKELRTLPGLNLMSLCISMLISHLIWLIGTANFQDTKTCEVLGIIEHYLFLVTFMAMSMISYHSCVVFSQPFNGNSNKSLGRFGKYSTISWLIPGIFIAVCIALDQSETTFDIYGTTCWLSTDEAVLYLFLLPAAVLLLCNIYTFIKTAVALSRYNTDMQILQRDRKQNVIVCTKLATLVGFPWVFAFFGVIFPDIEVFEYLFVVFACLQGFCIGVAFVCNKKTLQLYKKWWKSGNQVSAESDPRNQTFQMS